MPFNPAVNYRGDQYLAQGIGAVGDSVSEALQRMQKERQESQFLDEQINGILRAGAPLAKEGMIDPDLVAKQIEKAGSMGLAQKRGFAASLAFELSQAQKHADRQLQSKRDQELADYRNNTLELQQQSAGRRQEVDAANAGFLSGMGGVLGSADPEMRDANLGYLIQGNPGVDPALIEHVMRGIATMEAAKPKPRLSAAEDLEQVNLDDKMTIWRSKTTGQILRDQRTNGGQSILPKLLTLKTGLQKTMANALTANDQRPMLERQIAEIDQMISEAQGGSASPSAAPAVPAAAASAPASGAVMRMRNPQGRVVEVPSERYDQAVKAGYKPLSQ